MFPNNKKIKQFDKSDIHFCTDWVDYELYTETIRDHTLMYVYTGELIVWEDDRKHEISANECIFLRKGSTVTASGGCKDGETFSATYIRLRKCFLKSFFRRLGNKTVFSDISNKYNDTQKINTNPDIKSLFYSLIPYQRENQLPTPATADIKLQAGVFSLLNMRNGFYSILFDFAVRWNFQWIEFF